MSKRVIALLVVAGLLGGVGAFFYLRNTSRLLGLVREASDLWFDGEAGGPDEARSRSLMMQAQTLVALWPGGDDDAVLRDQIARASAIIEGGSHAH